MQFRRAPKMSLVPDLTPMIDCVFQLLIFFFLSSTFMSPAVPLDLPQAIAGDPEREQKIRVSLDGDNRLYINKAKIERGELDNRLLTEFSKFKTREVVLRADRKLRYEKVLDVLVRLREAGCAKIHLAYESERK